MPHKHMLTPKDARVARVSQEQDDDSDDFDDLGLYGGPQKETRRPMTGTQSLVDFLNNTSPEEFQRTPERTTGSFFRRRKKTKQPHTRVNAVARPTASTTTGDSSMSFTSASTLTSFVSVQKNHIAIVAMPTDSNASSVGSTPTLVTGPPEPHSPILPTRRRESSLYSGSLRRHGTLGQKSNMGSLASHTAQTRPTVSEVFMSQEEDMVHNELARRLAQHAPSPQTTPAVPTLHKVRHTQTQTESSQVNAAVSIQATPSQTPSMPPHVCTHEGDSTATVERLRQRIAEERHKQRLLKIATENTLDHYEVLSGLAYRKLREMWEEKMRWENACLELRERLEEYEKRGRKPVAVAAPACT